MKLGVFGGTFDPPHVGHLILASGALNQLELDRILWVLTPSPPHKVGRTITPVADRLLMLQATLAGEPSFELSRVDIERPAPHYAVDTMRMLRERNRGTALTYLMGGDSLADLPQWHACREFLLACDALGVMCRPGQIVDLDALEKELPGLRAKVQFIQNPPLDISSSQLRKRMSQGGNYRYYLPPAVYDIIQQRGLYGLVNS